MGAPVLRRVVAFAAMLLSVVFSSASAYAWKPFTHNSTALQAYQDAVDDGKLQIGGRTYSLSPVLVTSLRNWPQYYNAGVIGPDGFPDLTFGQSVIHPGAIVPGAPKTGAWLAHILRSALEAQNDASLSSNEKQQILAFSFGFLTHGAGDMWGHTFVNDFAKGVFPSVGEILSDPSKAAIALRHFAVEGYVGDATPGFDGNQDTSDPRDARAPAPGGDVSDDSTPSFPYDAPHAFIYRTLIDPAAATPSPDRGPLIGFYINLRSGLQGVLTSNPHPLQDAIDSYDDTVAALQDVSEDCAFDDLSDVVTCPASLLELGFDVAIDSAEAFARFVTGTVELAAKQVLNAYLAAWIDDIDSGLRHWSELGLASTKAFFDPQARRNLQNDECEFDGPDDVASLLRANCEHNIGMVDTLLEESDDFVNDHLLGMTGGPALDLVGDLREILESIGDVVEDVIGTITAPFNPLREVLAEVKQYIGDLIEDAVSDVLGINIESLKDIATHVSRYTCAEHLDFDFPVLGHQTISMFPTGTHDRLDGLLGLASDHHVEEEGFPPECGRLQDSAELQYDAVAATKNTVTMSKLLLLEGTTLNQVLSDILGRQISTYAAGQNVMTQGLGDNAWLRSIDSDHAWRQDGLPRFCDDGMSCPGGATSRPAIQDGGQGTFPLWESCVLRPAFRQLFSDWEGTSFPELGDAPGADPANDPSAPTSTLTLGGTTFTSGTTTFVAANNFFTLTAKDGPVGQAFADDQLGLQWRFYPQGGSPGAFIDAAQGATFSLTGADGAYVVGVHSADPCHSFANAPEGPEAEKISSYYLDATPPQLTCPSPPFGLRYDTASTITLQFSVSDGAGSGVASSTAQVDGVGSQAGTSPTATGTILDLFDFYPGTRHVTVSSADNLGNAKTDACTFEVHATVESLLSNLQRAFLAGKITNAGIYNSLNQKLNAALAAKGRGQPAVEHNVMGAFINELQAQRGKKVEAATADRFIAFAQDLITSGG